MTCAPSFFPGPWDAVVVPAALFFSHPDLRRRVNLVVYGPPHLLRAAWLGGAQEYLREPWQAEELFLRLRGPNPPWVDWSWGDRAFRLEGRVLSLESGLRVRLSPAEAELLRLLIQRRGMAVSRPVLAWVAGCAEGRVVDTLIARLRRKVQGLAGMDDDPFPGVRGLGYRLP